MLNILGGARPTSHLEIAKVAENIRGAHVHMYGKHQARPGRKMGHITVMANSMREVEQQIEPLIRAVDFVRMESRSSSDVATSDQSNARSVSSVHTSNAEDVVVAVTMGSHSDLPVLKPGLEILKKLKIPFEVNITSAHRTPELMMEFAKQAAPRGIKVIIAAAGGAAHLPGMIAALTPLPVVGIPVKTSTLDGVDSLYSIVQMPVGPRFSSLSKVYLIMTQDER
jgi:phosphoribosylaminoimidazole carboxylase